MKETKEDKKRTYAWSLATNLDLGRDQEGIEWIESLIDSVEDAIKYDKEPGQSASELEEAIQDRLYELADGAVPIYNYQLNDLWIDINGREWEAEAIAELGAPDPMTVEKLQQTTIYHIAYNLLNTILSDEIAKA